MGRLSGTGLLCGLRALLKRNTLTPDSGDAHGRMFQDPLIRTYDAIVVGSGATGGWAAKRLSEAGLEVAVLEAGRNVSSEGVHRTQTGL